MIRRGALAKHWLFTNNNNVNLKELLLNIFDKTCTQKAKKYIQFIQEDELYYIVKLAGFDHPVYYPKSMPLKSLFQVISESFYNTQWHYYEVPETRVSENDTVVDCGAAEGLFSLMVANKCSEVYAIEPLPSFVKAMQYTFKNFNNVNIVPVGLAEETGEAHMNDNSISSAISDSGNTIVNLETIDNLFYNQNISINYIKADLEGFEMNMLRGAKNTINANKPKIAITTYHRKEHAAQITDFLKKINPDYRIKVKGIEERHGAPVMLHAW